MVSAACSPLLSSCLHEGLVQRVCMPSCLHVVFLVLVQVVFVDEHCTFGWRTAHALHRSVHKCKHVQRGQATQRLAHTRQVARCGSTLFVISTKTSALVPPQRHQESNSHQYIITVVNNNVSKHSSYLMPPCSFSTRRPPMKCSSCCFPVPFSELVAIEGGRNSKSCVHKHKRQQNRAPVA